MIELPKPLLQTLEQVNGFHRDSFIAAHQQPPPVSIRLNPEKWLAERAVNRLVQGNIQLREAVPWSADGWYLKERPIFTLDPSIHAGGYYVQEASSMFIEHMLRHLLGTATGLRLLDLCAAPGGKTTLLASMKQFDLVVANEIIRSRVSILYENVVKWGMPKIFISNDDPHRFSSLPGYFDVMVVDAPCSGSGLFRKDHAALNEWSEANVQHCAERQKRILADALPCLKAGGILLYSTCSYSPEEDEEMLDWICSFAAVETVAIPVDEDWGIVQTQSRKGAAGYRFFPGTTQGEGFFVAAFRLLESVSASKTNIKKKMAPKGSASVSLPQLWVDNRANFQTITAGDDIYLVPQHLYEDHVALREVLSVRKSGVKAGTLIRGEFLPDHELILSSYLSASAPRIPFNKESALQYLRKQTVDPPAASKGWHVADYEGLSLGLLKHLGNRVNNYYPAAWRILMS